MGPWDSGDVSVMVVRSEGTDVVCEWHLMAWRMVGRVCGWRKKKAYCDTTFCGLIHPLSRRLYKACELKGIILPAHTVREPSALVACILQSAS